MSSAEIISIGTEIMLGEITDTNAAFIASQLPQYGIDLLYVSQVGDNPQRMRELLRRAWERSDITFTTGGLGPTEDDLTREMIAAELDEELQIDPEQERILRGWMERRGRPMAERNLKQAMLIASARVIPNERGTAPGWWVEQDNRAMVVMPGPPAEMNAMWERHVAPELESRATGILVTRTLKTTGLGESSVDEILSPLLSSPNPSIGIYARRDGVHARIAAKAPTRELAWDLIHPVENQVRNILGASIWGEDDETLAGAIGRLLHDERMTLAVMESATGGAIGDAITDVAGASEYFRGSLATYSTQTKIDLGVPADVIDEYGVISQRTAESMAMAVRARLNADIGLGVTGIAGTEEVEGQPPGTMHIALYDGEHIEYSHFVYYQGREAAKRRAVLQALSLLRGYLIDPDRSQKQP